jgi:hypothetical protein
MSNTQKIADEITEGMQVQTPFKKGLYLTLIALLVSAVTALWFSHAAVQKRLEDCRLEQTVGMERLKNEQIQQMREQEKRIAERIAEVEEKYRQILFNVSEAKREVKNKLKQNE